MRQEIIMRGGTNKHSQAVSRCTHKRVKKKEIRPTSSNFIRSHSSRARLFYKPRHEDRSKRPHCPYPTHPTSLSSGNEPEPAKEVRKAREVPASPTSTDSDEEEEIQRTHPSAIEPFREFKKSVRQIQAEDGIVKSRKNTRLVTPPGFRLKPVTGNSASHKQKPITANATSHKQKPKVRQTIAQRHKPKMKHRQRNLQRNPPRNLPCHKPKAKVRQINPPSHKQKVKPRQIKPLVRNAKAKPKVRHINPPVRRQQRQKVRRVVSPAACKPKQKDRLRKKKTRHVVPKSNVTSRVKARKIVRTQDMKCAAERRREKRKVGVASPNEFAKQQKPRLRPTRIPDEPIGKVTTTKDKWVLTLDFSKLAVRHVKVFIADKKVEVRGIYCAQRRSWKKINETYTIPDCYPHVVHNTKNGIWTIVARGNRDTFGWHRPEWPFTNDGFKWPWDGCKDWPFETARLI